LHVSPSIQVLIAEMTTIKDIWDHLKANYSQASIGAAYSELSRLLSTSIPSGTHPAPAITKILSHFTYLKDAGFDIPAPVQAMIVLCKLPPTMEVVAQILSQTTPDEIKNLKPDGIAKAATLSFEQKASARSSGSGKGPQANKLSAVKRKPADPKFAQQQQQPNRPQQQQGGPNGSASGNAPAQGQKGYR
jgi:gag-polypeptide of LTR copia-type